MFGNIWPKAEHPYFPKNMSCIPLAYGCFYFEAYGYEPTESGGYNRCLTAHYYEDHQYLRVCASSNIEDYAEAVREVCNQYGKELRIDPTNQ